MARSGAARAFGKHMLDAKSGSIVNIGSMSGFIVNKTAGAVLLQRLEGPRCTISPSRSRPSGGARGVRVNAVAPTYVTNPPSMHSSKAIRRCTMPGSAATPMARMGEVDEIASVVLFLLASDAASLMTGSVVLVDGGYTCW